ncbi:MAG: glycerol-3-phosphate 1-O-acyltransferase PlsY [Trueperaceae bacterium]|nr:glycerol-3-phosphate 1-O-acyltransferase PlsY [Trueperaceae bacterium]
MIALICILVGYLLGSIPSGYLMAKAYGVNIQKVGSGNIGATNVLRTIGLVPALVVVVSDPLKGLLAVLIAKWAGLEPWLVVLTALVTILGNNFNIFLRLKGGKGVATSLGVFLGVAPAAAIAGAVIGLVTMYLGRYVSLGSLVGLFSAPLVLALRTNDPPALVMGVAIFLLALYRHRENVRRLAEGTERRIGDKKKKLSVDETVRNPSAPTDTLASGADATPPVQPDPADTRSHTDAADASDNTVNNDANNNDTNNDTDDEANDDANSTTTKETEANA